MFNRARKTIPVICVLLAIACDGDVATAPQRVERPSFLTASTTCGKYGSALPTNFVKHWTCGQALDLVARTSGDSGTVEGVENAWNSALHAEALNLPYFSDNAVGRHRIAVGHQSGLSNFAGSVFPQDPSLDPDSINMASGSNGAFLPVLYVETSHVMGYNDWWEPLGHNVVGVTDHCVRTANAQGVYTNTTPCQHELEGIYAAYGVRAAPPDEHKHIITGISGLPTSTVTMSVGDTLSAKISTLEFDRVNPAFCLPDEFGDYDCTRPPSIANFNWSVAGTGVSLSGSGNSQRLMTAVAPGTATVTVTFAATDTNEVTALFGTSFSPNSFDVSVIAPPPPPSSISASSVTYNSAVINWVNGDPAASTVVEYQYAGQPSWSSVTASAGATSKSLTGLLSSTTYSVRLHHVRNGLSSSLVTASNLFQTAVAPPPPPLPSVTSFYVSGCSGSLYGGKTYNNWTVSWSTDPAAGPTIYYDIGESTTSSSSSAFVVVSGKANTGQATLPPFLRSTSPNTRYFWIRMRNSSSTGSWGHRISFDVAGECAL